MTVASRSSALSMSYSVERTISLPLGGQNKSRLVLDKRQQGWFVSLAASTELGPFMNAAFALRVMATHLYMARKNDGNAYLVVRDDAGDDHRCNAVDDAAGIACCSKCMAAWPLSARGAKCPLQAEFASNTAPPNVI
jgi:hypothetical protein